MLQQKLQKMKVKYGIGTEKIESAQFPFYKGMGFLVLHDDKTLPSKNSFFGFVFSLSNWHIFFPIVYALKPQQLVASKIPPYKLDQHLASINVWHMSNVAFDVVNDVVKLAFCFFT